MSEAPPVRAAAPGLLPHKIKIVKGGDKTTLLPLPLGLGLGLGLVRGQVASVVPAPSHAAPRRISVQSPTTVRPLPASVCLVAPPAHHPATTVTKQLTSYHVPRGPATVANLSVPRAVGAPRPPASSAAPGWSTSSAQLRPNAVVYAPRPNRPHALQLLTKLATFSQITAAPKPATLRPALPPVGTSTTVVARAVRPANVPSPQRTPPPQVLQTAVTPIRTTTLPKVVPLVQRNYQSTKVVGVALGVRPGMGNRTVTGPYYYEVSGGIGGATQSSSATATVSSLPLSTSVHSLPISMLPSHTTVAAFGELSDRSKFQYRSLTTTSESPAVSNLGDANRGPGSPPGPQRPSILRKRENEGEPFCSIGSLVKSQFPTASPPPSPGGSTTVSAASSPEPEDEAPSPPPAPPPIPPPQPILSLFANCSPRKKPRKQLLSSEARGARGSADCEFPSEGIRMIIAPSPPPVAIPPPAPAPPEAEKPPRRAMLGAGWTCGWRANALHFVRPCDVKRREDRRPSVVELAAQKHVLQKANGWKIHHLTAQMDDLIDLENGVLEQAREALRAIESYDGPNLHRVCELLKGNIQRSQIVCGGVGEARTNVMRVFQHKSRVSDILARQADKRCFKKHRNQY